MIAKFFYLSSLFLSGIIASSCLAWLTTIHPYLKQGVLTLTAITALVWIILWGCDDAIAAYLNIQPIVIRSTLLGSLLCVLIGGGVLWIFRML